MDTRFAVFIVHGIGTQGKRFSHAMQENLRSKFKKALRHMGQENREGQDDALIFRGGNEKHHHGQRLQKQDRQLV